MKRRRNYKFNRASYWELVLVKYSAFFSYVNLVLTGLWALISSFVNEKLNFPGLNSQNVSKYIFHSHRIFDLVHQNLFIGEIGLLIFILITTILAYMFTILFYTWLYFYFWFFLFISCFFFDWLLFSPNFILLLISLDIIPIIYSDY